MVENVVDRDGIIVRYIWNPFVSLKGIAPIYQVYGLCFTKDGMICIIRNPLSEGGFTPWYLPGGTPNEKESPENTLIREINEEIDCDVSNMKLLGANEVFFPNNPNKEKGDHYYQLRYFALIKKARKQTPDPHDGKLVERKFIDPAEFTNHVKWGKPGEAQIKAALAEYNFWKKSR